ncbi:MAG: hypothetical protein NZT92_07250 [Abditibacteriales bacterium]|nr:hypothetical protein [Abditibacteriales bacterium]MDW8364371.1 hypothetical protein [Abditibacteriales bacterium]
MTALTDTSERDRSELYEHLRTHGWVPADTSPALRRAVYLMAWRALSPAVKAALSQTRTAFHIEQHERIERAALLSLPPYQRHETR